MLVNESLLLVMIKYLMPKNEIMSILLFIFVPTIFLLSFFHICRQKVKPGLRQTKKKYIFALIPDQSKRIKNKWISYDMIDNYNKLIDQK